MSTVEGCASVADGPGNLLFYTDGITVWNQSHSVMSNGGGLFGNQTPAQSSIIIKKPGSSILYYIFTVQGAFGNLGLNYSIIDMSLSSGTGSIVIKNSPLFSFGCSERITAARHCNGIDYWIITNDHNTNNFRCHLLTSGGVTSVPVISAVGAFNNNLNSVGCMKVSPNGKKLGRALANTSFELLDFDNSTGIVSNPLTLISFAAGSNYGCEFSTDGTKFYGTRPVGTGTIYQWDLCAGSNSAIIASQYSINASLGLAMSMQLATNGKIYIAGGTVSNLAVINNPNISGAGCNYTNTGQSVAPKLGFYGLPNFASSAFLQPPSSPSFTFTVSNTFGCQTASFTAPPIAQNFTNITCSASSYSLTGFVWNFGDPLSGINNSSGLPNPSHAYTSLGTYTAQLILYYSCGGGTDTLSQVVNVTQPCISVSSTSITCASLGSATVTTTGGIGPYSYTWTPSSQTGSVASGLSPGTYTITVYDAGNNITSTATTVFTSLIPLTGSFVATSSVNCFGANNGTAAVINLAGGSGTQTTVWTDGTNTFSNSPVNTLGAGSWSVTVTDVLTACQVFSVFTITQPSPLSLSITANTPTNCVGASIALSATNSGGTPGYTYSWTSGPSVNTNTVAQLTGGTYVYTLNSSDANNCLTSNTISVDFVNNPILSVSNISICPLAIGTLTVSGASSYTWLASTPLSVTATSFTASPISNQQYSVIGSAFGCSSTASASIILHPIPIPILGSSSPLCNGQSLQLSGAGGAFYYWTGPSGFTSSLQMASINPASTAYSGIYNLTVTSVYGCTAATSSSLTVNPTPTLSALGSTVCTTQTVTLSGSSEPGASYLWSGPIGFASNQQNPTIVSPIFNNSGVYLLKVSSVQGCSNVATATVQVVSPPSLTVALSSPSLCWQAFNGSPNTIVLTSAGANTYTLFTPNLIGSSTQGGGTNSLTSVPPYNSSLTIGTATLVGSNGVCASSTTSTFAVIPNPTIGLNSYTPVICAGQSFTYTSFGAQSYIWGPGTPGLTTYTSYITVANPSVTSIYSVFGGSLGCYSPTQTTTITVIPIPTIALNPSLPQICKFDKVNLVASGTGTSYSWSPFIALNTNSGSIVVASPTITQSYAVLATANTCTSSAQITVTVLPLPTASISVTSPSICLNENLNLTGLGGLAYNWRGPSELSFEGKTITLVANNMSFAGIYTLTVTDGNGCKNSTQQLITINNLPNGSLLGLKENGCVPLCGNYEFSPNSNGISSSWTINKQVYSGGKFYYCFNQAGTYTINGSLLDSKTSCNNSIEFYVTVRPRPEANFQYTPLKPVENLDEVIFTNTSNGEQQKQWNWFFNDNKGFKTKSENTSYLYQDAGQYPVVMIVKNTWGCSDTIMKIITVEPDFVIYVPNAFTPNQDSQNEIFLPILRSAKLYNLKIYDRWGGKIFETAEISQGWDGSYNGEMCKEDVYTWKIVVSSEQGEQKVMTGHVSLYR